MWSNEWCCAERPLPAQSVKSTRLSAFSPAADFARDADQSKEAQVQHHVFNWLDWSPTPGSKCYRTLHEHFPGALPGPAVHSRISNILECEQLGFKVGKTLFGASICPDEINNKVGDLADIMKTYWGNIFPLGGISGAPFVGATGFKAFSAHVPDNGDIIILFGPHVAISAEGEIGKHLRDGQHQTSTSCGAVIGAYKACSSVSNNKQGEEDDFNEMDMQMEWIKAQLEPHVARIKAQSNPMAALAYQALEMVKAKLEMIVNTDFGSGRLVLVGGLQINMPSPCRDHFLPLTFDVHQKGQCKLDLLSTFTCKFITQMAAPKKIMPDAKKALVPDAKRAPKNPAKTGRLPQAVDIDALAAAAASGAFQGGSKGQGGSKRKDSIIAQADFDHLEETLDDEQAVNQHVVFAWLQWSPEIDSPCYSTLHKEFPGALPGTAVYHRVNMLLKDFGFTPGNTLFGSSICADEINNTPQSLTALMSSYWGAVFPMGGLGGVPFAGKTGFKAFSAHVPDDGNIVIVFGPHVAVSEEGEVGMYLRRGQQKNSTACGAVIGAYHACCANKTAADVEFDETDMQMGWIKSQVAPHCARIREQECEVAALTYQAFKIVQEKINKVVDTGFGRGRLVLIGGIQLNLPSPCEDHFLPMSFEVRQAGVPTECIKKAFNIPLPLM